MSNNSSGSDNDEAGYEVEAVVDYRKKKGKEEFLIKWKNYESEDNSWEPVELVAAPEMIAAYWALEATKGRIKPEKKAVKNESKAKVSKAIAATDSSKKRKETERSDDAKFSKRQSDGAKADEISYTPEHLLDPALLETDAWDDLVKEVGTIEGTNKEGSFLVYLLWKDGLRSTHYSHVTNRKCPQKMLKFYETHLKFS